MHLIIGGAWQGKLDFAVETYGFTSEQICHCTADTIDFSSPCIAHVEEYVYGCIQRGEDATALFAAHRQQWANSVILCRDIFGGLVPIDPTERAWRKAAGHLCKYLSGEADRVSRIFCGMEQRLK